MTTTLAPTEDVPVEKTWTLNASHRCDNCGSQAYVSVEMVETGFDLLFCAHHFNKYQPKLSTLDAIVTDERERLFAVAKLDVSA